MRARGRLTEWNDDRGFGFVTPLDGDPRAFAHISEFPRDKRRPATLDLVEYTLEHDERNRPRATGITYLVPTLPERSARPPRPGPEPLVAPLVVAGLFALLLLLLIALGVLPSATFGLYGFFSVLAFVTYGTDKAAAEQGRRRTPESTLHMLALLGGWPGALVAQRLYRHKTRKASFQLVFWLTVAVNCAVMALLAAQAVSFPG